MDGGGKGRSRWMRSAVGCYRRRWCPQSLLQTNPEVATALTSIVHSVSEKARILYGTDPKLPVAFLQADDVATSKVAQAMQGRI